LTELSNRFDLGDDVHFLTIAEVSELPRDRDVRRRIVERRSAYRVRRQLHVPALLSVEGDMEDFGLPPPEATSGRRLTATALSYGQASGRVFLSDRPDRGSQLPRGSVVVASTIDPGSMLLLADAAAFVVEQGGILSHAAILARELSIPAVVVERITELVTDDEAVRVDADRGYVEFTERPS
jgi:pyruvate,water dikinase